MIVAPVVSFPEGQPAIWCDACGVFHELNMNPAANPQGQRWAWNRDVYKPTFYPMAKFKVISAKLGKTVICHFEVFDGKITYQPDCQHAYAGQTHNLQPPR